MSKIKEKQPTRRRTIKAHKKSGTVSRTKIRKVIKKYSERR